MNTQPKPLRLADILEKMPLGECDEEAAAELRRLHQSEREGWRHADELEQERRRLQAELEAMTQCAKNHDISRTKYLLMNQELLEALKTLYEDISSAVNMTPFVLNKAVAAIAKAEEKQ